MGIRATITLNGPASYSEPGRPRLLRGQPLVTSDAAVIEWAKRIGFLDVNVDEIQEKQQEVETPGTQPAAEERVGDTPVDDVAPPAPTKSVKAPVKTGAKVTVSRKKAK